MDDSGEVVAPQSAQIMVQGGSFNANRAGFYSLFSNPAAYAGEKPSLTVVSVMPWIYAFPRLDVIEALAATVEDPASGIPGLNELLSGPGFGAGSSTGVGYVGNGLKFGLVGMADVYGWGPNTFGINVDSNITAGFGLQLFFLDLNTAYFGREMGSFAGSRQSQGITAELAVRF